MAPQNNFKMPIAGFLKGALKGVDASTATGGAEKALQALYGAYFGELVLGIDLR